MAKHIQKDFNDLLRKATTEILVDINKKLPSASNFYVIHVYKGSRFLNKHNIVTQEFSKFKGRGITFLTLNHKGYYYIYTSTCHSADNYHKNFGKKEVLSKLNKDVQSKDFKNYDFKIPMINIERRDLESSIIYLKLMSKSIASHLKLNLSNPSVSDLIEALGGVPLLLRDCWAFIETEGVITSTVELPNRIEKGDIYEDVDWKHNINDLLQKVFLSEVSSLS